MKSRKDATPKFLAAHGVEVAPAPWPSGRTRAKSVSSPMLRVPCRAGVASPRVDAAPRVRPYSRKVVIYAWNCRSITR